MQYDGEKYYYGTKFINNADGLLTDIYRATDDIKGYHGFEYKNTLNEIKMTIFGVMSDCAAISNTIEMGRQNIASMNSDFDVQYLEASHYDFSNMSVTEQEENRYLIKYTDEEIARELKKHQNNAANVDISDEALRTSMMLNDQNFSNLSVEEQQDQIDNFRDEVIKYQKMSWYEKVLKNTGAFVGGAANGLANVVESVVDGDATLKSAYVLYATPVGPLMSVASYFQEQSGVAKEDTFVGKYKEKVKDFVSKNWVDDACEGIVEKYGMNKYIWKGKCYTTGKTVGTMAGYTGLSFIPGGPVVTGVVTGLAAAGDAAETAYNNGASYDQGVVAAGVAGGVGFISGVGLDKIRGASKLVTTKAGVLGYTLLGSGTAMSEPVVNAVAQYNLYAKNQIDENGNKVYNNFGDYFKKSGGLQSTFMAAGIGGASILPSAVKNYKTNLIETKLSQEMLDNVYRLDFDNPSQYNEYLDSLTSEQRTAFMTNYYSSMYGEAFEGNFSGPISYVDPKAKEFNKNLLLTKAHEISGWIDITEPKALIWTIDPSSGKLKVDQDWPKLGGLKSETIKSVENLDGEIIEYDRIGSKRGGTYGLVPSNGKPYSMAQRSIFNNMSSPDPDVSGYRKGFFNKSKYIDFCDGAYDIISYCKANNIDWSEASLNPVVQQKIENLTTKIGLDLNSDISKVDAAIFGERGSYISDLALKDGSYYDGNGTKSGAWRDDIVGVEDATGISSKYGYVGKAAKWVTSDGEVIAIGGAGQLNLRTCETTLNSLGIMKSSDNLIFNN